MLVMVALVGGGEGSVVVILQRCDIIRHFFNIGICR